MDKNINRNILRRTPGRGATENESSRFDQWQKTVDLSDAGWIDEEDIGRLNTEFFEDKSKSILSENKSPDIPFRYGLNPYRGCEHGCIYCYARPTHEYLGHSAGLDFESKIYVKYNAPELLREKFMSASWKPEIISISGVTDCYQPAERRFEITRKCLEVFAEFKNPVGLITKNFLITRDVDLISDLAKEQLAAVYISVTTLDHELGRVMEPRTSAPQSRLKAIEILAKAGVPVGVNVGPVIPGLTDHELPAILKAAAEAGATQAGYILLRLPYSVKDLFYKWLEKNRPEKMEKVLAAIRETREGNLNNAEFGERMRGQGPHAENIANLFKIFSEKYGFNRESVPLATDRFRRPGDQLAFF